MNCLVGLVGCLSESPPPLHIESVKYTNKGCLLKPNQSMHSKKWRRCQLVMIKTICSSLHFHIKEIGKKILYSNSYKNKSNNIQTTVVLLAQLNMTSRINLNWTWLAVEEKYWLINIDDMGWKCIASLFKLWWVSTRNMLLAIEPISNRHCHRRDINREGVIYCHRTDINRGVSICYLRSDINWEVALYCHRADINREEVIYCHRVDISLKITEKIQTGRSSNILP